MKKRNHPANVVDVSSRIMGLLGRRKVDPTTEAMRALKGLQDEQIARGEYIGYVKTDILAEGFMHENGLAADVPRFALPLHLQQCGRFMRQPGLTPDEQQRLIDVLEKHLT